MGRFDRERSISESNAMPLTGAILVVLGSMIVVFDYPQIEYLGGFDASPHTDAPTGRPDARTTDSNDIHARLIVEFSIGVAILVAGTAMCAPKAASYLGRRLRY